MVAVCRETARKRDDPMPDCGVFATGFGKRRSAKRIYLTNCFSYYEFSTASVQWTRAGDGCRRERTEAWSFRHGRRNIVMRARNSYRSADRRAALVRDLMLAAGAVVGLCGAGLASAQTAQDRQGVVSGKRVSGVVDLGGRRV